MIQPPYYHYRPHPWHGLDAGTSPPDLMNAYIEITPFDLVKYEVDKRSGFLRVDRPQRTSSTPPTLYGFIPKTLCGPRVAKVGGIQSGDNDPLDICVLSERPIDRVEVILETRVLGGLLMEDNGQADDKIVAVLKDDAIFSNLLAGQQRVIVVGCANDHRVELVGVLIKRLAKIAAGEGLGMLLRYRSECIAIDIAQT